MALAFLNACGFRAVSSGTGDFVVASALTGYYEPDDCASPVAVDGATYHYHAISDDGTQFLEGDGVWDEGTQTLTRGTLRNGSDGAGNNVTFSAAPRVFMGGPLAGDMHWRVIADGSIGSASSELAIPIDLTGIQIIRIEGRDVEGEGIVSIAFDAYDDNPAELAGIIDFLYDEGESALVADEVVQIQTSEIVVLTDGGGGTFDPGLLDPNDFGGGVYRTSEGTSGRLRHSGSHSSFGGTVATINVIATDGEDPVNMTAGRFIVYGFVGAI